MDSSDAQPEAKRRKLDSADSPLEAYRALLQAEVKSTRTKWPEFVKAHKRDRRFLGYGRSDRDRERAFKDWLVELGDKKREAQMHAEDDFLSLLDSKIDSEARAGYRTDVEQAAPSTEEHKTAQRKAWTEAKLQPGLDSDPKYEAVGSSTRRAELFAEWLDGKHARQQESSKEAERPGGAITAADREKEAQEQKKREKALNAERALKARQEQVQRERDQAESRQRRVLTQATHSEDVIAFKQMLIDHVRDPLTTFFQLADTLGRSDKRFSTSSLRLREKEELLWEHVRSLLGRRRNALRSIFGKVAPSLATSRDVALPLVREEDEWERAELGCLLWGEKEQVQQNAGRGGRRESEWGGLKSLDREWDDWNAERAEKAEREFKEMLSENGFVEFWGRLKHHRQNHDPDAPPAEDLDSDDEDAVGMLEMAKKIDLAEIDAVLQPDGRYQAWKHRPDLVEDWIREHMEGLAAPKQTIHGPGLTSGR
ncbi:unnamed protein product [Tilletia controversa]|uniref:FF domain-containing protein n=3 Tax=Tilletia TaxID=13289 RepID=A0A8X7ML25_9BASI|nr:hypothetical protein CF336_g7546 [Tilletia laevis]KAE8186256.1 hypothetical protein CF328_g7286 [Tilletia controversa]KAE8247741.1 hypothetical protein A4X03_0g6967 [Tilletia caries]KAE8187974.1 hypothetical protein CF335_g7014 [Tilletia laevis]KAE8240242.1 hypothetical protein A4X06_0g7848 [Tilletia controversa]